MKVLLSSPNKKFVLSRSFLNFLRTFCKLKVVRNKRSKFFSHRYLIEFYETNRTSRVPHLYDVKNLLSSPNKKFVLYRSFLNFLRTFCKLKVVRNKRSKFFSYRYLIEFYETHRTSRVPHLYNVVNLLK